jgi:hypothetical protein
VLFEDVGLFAEQFCEVVHGLASMMIWWTVSVRSFQRPPILVAGTCPWSSHLYHVARGMGIPVAAWIWARACSGVSGLVTLPL